MKYVKSGTVVARACCFALVILAAGTAHAVWWGFTSATQVSKQVSPLQDITGLVGHLNDYHLYGVGDTQQHTGEYTSQNSGHSLGPASGHTANENVDNTLHAEWGSTSASDSVKSGAWGVGMFSWWAGSSVVVNGANYDGIYQHRIKSITVTQFTPSGSTDFSPTAPAPGSGQWETYSRLTDTQTWSGQADDPNTMLPVSGGSAGLHPGMDPALTVDTVIMSSLTHHWDHPPEPITSSAQVLAFVNLRVVTFIKATPWP